MRRNFRVRFGAGLLAALALSGCGGYITQLPIVGPGNVPPPPETRPEYPSVGVKSGPDVKAMTAAERLKLETELMAARTGSVAERRLLISQPATPGVAPAAPAAVPAKP